MPETLPTGLDTTPTSHPYFDCTFHVHLQSTQLAGNAYGVYQSCSF
jgi:hypothetical protein